MTSKCPPPSPVLPVCLVCLSVPGEGYSAACHGCGTRGNRTPPKCRRQANARGSGGDSSRGVLKGRLHRSRGARHWGRRHYGGNGYTYRHTMPSGGQWRLGRLEQPAGVREGAEPARRASPAIRGDGGPRGLHARFTSGIGTSLVAAFEGGRGPARDLALSLVGSLSLIRHGVLENAANMVGQLEVELRGVEARLAKERPCLAHGWHQLETAVKLGHHQNEAARARGEKSTAKVNETSEHAFREAEAADR